MQRDDENPSTDAEDAPGGANNDDDVKDPKGQEEDIDKPLEPAIDNFQKAMESACSPNIVNELFDNLAGKVNPYVAEEKQQMQR